MATIFAKSSRLAKQGAMLVLLVVAGTVATPAAHAATVSLEGDVLSYRAEPGERNYIVVTLGASQVSIVRTSARIRLLYTPSWPKPESSRLSASTGCAVVTDGDDVDDRDVVGVDDPAVSCPFAGKARPRLNVELGDRSDYGAFDKRLRARVTAGSGGDTLIGSGVLDGGPGDDVLTVTGGRFRTARGGLGRDQLEVSEGVKAGAVLEGGRGNDRMSGGDGSDVLRGGPGDDSLADLEGLSKRGDVYNLGSGNDYVSAGNGPDKIFARDGEFDRLSCFGGRDTIMLDALDFYWADPDEADGRCERVSRHGLPRAFPAEATAYLEADRDEGVEANHLEVVVACPYDGGRICAETVTVSDRRGIVLQKSFRTTAKGLVYDAVPMPGRTLRRLAKWARMTVVSFDRLGGLHRHTIAGPNVVDINDPDYCC